MGTPAQEKANLSPSENAPVKLKTIMSSFVTAMVGEDEEIVGELMSLNLRLLAGS